MNYLIGTALFVSIGFLLVIPVITMLVAALTNAVPTLP